MKSNLRLEVLPKRQQLLFDLFSGLDWIAGFYLAGGTSLALQIAHRRSVDFDFFTEQEFDVRLVRRKLAKLGDYQLLAESPEILDGKLNTVRVSFFNIPYPLVGPELRYRNLRIVSQEDVAAMKLSAISLRGSRKDFIDLFFLLKSFSLKELLGFYVQKYGRNEENIYCVLKGMVYFVDAEIKPMPGLLINVTWREIKDAIIKAHGEYIQSLRKGSK